MAALSGGVTFLPELKREHIELTSYSRMRVGLAAKVKLHANKKFMHYFNALI